MIDNKELKDALQTAKPFFSMLQAYYKNLPATECNCERPGVCCAYLPQMTLTEALQWFDIIRQLPVPEKVDTIRRFMRFYLTNPVHHSGCPFLAQGMCGIYTARTFACRAYGLWSRQTGNSRTEDNRRERRHLIKQWKRFGLELPAETVEFEIDYCDRVDVIRQPALSDGELIKVLEKIYDLDRNFPQLQKTFEEAYHSDLSLLMASLVLGFRKALLLKFAVIKEIVKQGSSNRLADMLSKVGPEVLDPD